MKYLVSILLTVFSLITYSQNYDSLKALLSRQKSENHGKKLQRLAITYLKDSQYDSANKYFEKAIAEFTASSDILSRAKSLNNIGVSKYFQGKYKESLVHYQESLNDYRLLGNDTLISQSLTNLGLTFKGLNIYENALKNLFEGAKILQQLELNQELASCWNAIGNIHRQLKNYGLSYEYLEKALQLRKQLKLTKGEGLSYQNLGIWHLEKNNYQEAYDHFIEAYDILKEIDRRNAAAILSKLGELMVAVDSIPHAEGYFLQSLAMRKRLNDHNGIAAALNNLSNLYVHTGDWEKARSHMEEAVIHITKTNSLNALAKNQRIQRDFYTSTRRYDEALKYANLLLSTREKVLDQEKIKALVNAEIKYEVDRIEYELIESDRLLQLEQNENKWLTLSLVISLVLVCLFVILYIVAKKLSQERKEGKAKVEKLIKELHHRTKNHLQGQSYLLKLQSRFIRDHSTKSIMEEASNRMKVVTLIHQSLMHSEDDPSDLIELHNYLQNMTENLMISFKYNRNKIQLMYDLHPTEIDVYRAVPIGLFINEAITNAFKYAFQHNITPVLKTSLNKKGKELIIRVMDNGAGFDVEKALSKNSFGLSIMEDMAQQLKGKMEIVVQGGTSVILRLPFKKI